MKKYINTLRFQLIQKKWLNRLYRLYKIMTIGYANGKD